MNNQKPKRELPDYVRRRLSEWGRMGGKKRAKVLSPAKRKEIATMGAKARVDSIVAQTKSNA